MSPRSRIAVLAAGVVVVVLAFVLLRPSGEEAPTVAEPATQTQAPVAATVEGSGGVGAPPAATPTTAVEPQQPAEPPVPTIVVGSDGQPRGGVQDLEFTSGEPIVFRVRSAVPEEIHVHGYDVERRLEPGRTATIRLDGELEGVFEVELHGSAQQIAELRVSPR